MTGRTRRAPRRRPQVRSWRPATLGVGLLAGVVCVAAAISSEGSDLRPAGGDVASLLQERADRVNESRVEASDLRTEIDRLSASVDDSALRRSQRRIERLQPDMGLDTIAGVGVKVVLSDAPRTVDASGLNPNDLVVHEQDLQAFVNALWAGGADAIDLMGQRLISTSGIKCVGNTVVLDGVPYSPPYVIRAVGDPTALRSSLAASTAVRTYGDYAAKYGLGLDVGDTAMTIAPYGGTIALDHARVAEG